METLKETKDIRNREIEILENHQESCTTSFGCNSINTEPIFIILGSPQIFFGFTVIATAAPIIYDPRTNTVR